MNYYDIILAKKLSGGGGGGSAVLINKNISANGTYNAASDNADGYKKVVVNVPNPSTGSLSITSNNTYDVTNYASAVVNVPTGITPTGTIPITQNGTVDVTNYASANVNVSGWTSDGIANGTEPNGDITVTSQTLLTHAFQGRTGITSITANSVISIPIGFLQSCSGLTQASFPNATEIWDDAFNSCSHLVSVDVRNVTKLRTKRIFSGCSSLTTFVGGLTKLQSFADQSFKNTRVPIFVLPSCTSVGLEAFAGNTALTTCDFDAVSLGSTSVFSGDTSLATLIIRKNSVASLNNINSFTNTPFADGGTGGTLYVPNDLIASYHSASNWSTILGYTNNQIKSIESTHTDPTAPIDLTLYYADGTPIGA